MASSLRAAAAGPVRGPDRARGSALDQEAVRGSPLPYVQLEAGHRPLAIPRAPEAPAEDVLGAAPRHLPEVKLRVDGLGPDRTPELLEQRRGGRAVRQLRRRGRRACESVAREDPEDGSADRAGAWGPPKKLARAFQKPITAWSPEPVSGRPLPQARGRREPSRMARTAARRWSAGPRPRMPRASPRRCGPDTAQSLARRR